MEEQAQHIAPMKQGIAPIAVGAGVATGGLAAYGAVEVAKNAIVNNYQAIRSNVVNAEKAVYALVNRTPEELVALQKVSDDALQALDNVKRKKLEVPEQIAIGAVVFVTVGLMVTAAVNAYQHREKPDAVIDPASVELSQQKVAQDMPEHSAFVK